MAANKFATSVYRKTKRNKVVVILVYAVLEWVLLALLLLNSLLSYLIYKFSSYFSLKTPCLFCSRLERLFDKSNCDGSRRCYRELLCENHCSEVSLLGYCTNHCRLAEASEMCEDCSSSRPSPPDLMHLPNITDHPVLPLFSLMKSDANGDDNKDLRCSCCHVSLENGFYSLDDFHLRNKPEPQSDNHSNQMALDSDSALETTKGRETEHVDQQQEDDDEDEEKEEIGGKREYLDSGKQTSLQVILGYKFHGSTDRIVPVKLIDSATLECLSKHQAEDKGDDFVTNQKVMDPFHDLITVFENNEVLISLADISSKEVDLSGKHNLDNNSVVLLEPLADLIIEKQQEESQASHNDAKTYYETDTEVTIGSEICDDELNDRSLLVQAPIPPPICKVDLIKFHDDSQNHEGQGDKKTDDAVNPEISGFFCTPELLDHPQFQQSITPPIHTSVQVRDETEKEQYLTLNSNPSSDRQLLEARFLLALIWSVSMLDGCVASENGNADNGMATYEVSEGRESCDPENNDDHQLQVQYPESCDQENNDDHQLQVQDPPLFDQLDDYKEMNAMADKEQASEATGETNGETALQNDQIAEHLHQKELLELFGGYDGSDDVLCESEINDQGDRRTNNDENHHELLFRNSISSNQGQYDSSHSRECIPPTTIQIDGPTEEKNQGTGFKFDPSDVTSNGVNHECSTCLEHFEGEEERAPDTPNSIQGMYNLLKRSIFDKREMGTESMDGSIASEMDACEPSTVDQLKGALRAERRALSALYAELEEERSASAIAANQTMAMINRLQEEKAAMQMEALQYQRMMEEQSEYDQEALQILNDLITKKEKEKQDLEKELEMYREKVMFYERKEKRMKSSQANGISTSPASSSDEDSNNLSVDPNKSEQNLYDLTEHNHKKSVDKTLADFEEERISILKMLNVLEEDCRKHCDADQNLYDPNDSPCKAAWMQKWHGMVEDFEDAYERLQALELDTQILKGSINSLKNGEEGQCLLKEISERFPDDRNVESSTKRYQQ